MVLGISREQKTLESLPSCVTAVIRQKFNSPVLLDSNIHKHENFKLTLFYMDTCFIIHLCPCSTKGLSPDPVGDP